MGVIRFAACCRGAMGHDLSGTRRAMPTGERVMTFLPEARCIETRYGEAAGSASASSIEPRARLTAQRGTRRVQLNPKYGSGPCAVEVSYAWHGAVQQLLTRIYKTEGKR